MKDFTTRRLQDRTVQAIIAEAKKRGAHAAPVFNRKGQVEEVHLFREGALPASISRPELAESGCGVPAAIRPTPETSRRLWRGGWTPCENNSTRRQNPRKWSLSD